MAAREKIGAAAEKGLKQQKNPDVTDGKEAEKAMKMKLNSTEEETMKITVPRETNGGSCFKPKGGSVLPAKRKSVKRMMFDRFVLKHLGSSAVSEWPPNPHKPE